MLRKTERINETLKAGGEVGASNTPMELSRFVPECGGRRCEGQLWIRLQLPFFNIHAAITTTILSVDLQGGERSSPLLFPSHYCLRSNWIPSTYLQGHSRCLFDTASTLRTYMVSTSKYTYRCQPRSDFGSLSTGICWPALARCNTCQYPLYCRPSKTPPSSITAINHITSIVLSTPSSHTSAP